VAVKDGRFIEIGRDGRGGPQSRVIDLRGRTVIPGIIDAHNHIVLVGNRPGHHVCAEDVFTLQDLIERYIAKAADVPPGEFITTIGPVAAQQFPEARLPTLQELDAVPRPVYVQAAQGGIRTNTAGRAWLEPRGVTVTDAGVVSGPALQRMREELLTPESRERTALDALQYFATLGITTHLDDGAFHAELPANGIASENVFTMHNPFLAIHARDELPVRLRINFLHQDPASDPTIPTLSARLRNSFPFFGDDMMKTGGIGEFTGGGVAGLRAIAAAGWRAEDHSLNLNSFQTLVQNREIVHAEIPLTDLRWVISHVPQTNEDLVNRFKAIGGGLLVGWGPTRGGTNVGPAYRDLLANGIPLGWHSDGGDITVISPWLNLYTTITGRNLIGAHILGEQMLTRQQAIRLATAANKWFIGEDDLGSIENGNHADFVVLDRDVFTCPEEEIKRIKSVLTVVGGKIVHDTGEVG
jgi:predicted amidohydrolase YtcJ